MTTEYLREFVTLAEMGNYAAAAEPLFISEATLSRHIMALEKELGAELFKRFPRRIELTEVGMVFLPYARQIVGAEDISFSGIARRQEFEKSSLSIGIDKTLAFYGVADILASFSKTHPEFVIQVSEGSSFELKESVESGILQAAFILDDPSNRSVGLKYKPFKNDTFVAAAAPGHKLTKQKSIHLSKLSSVSLLMPPQFTAMYELCAKAFRQAGLEPNSVISAELSGKTTKELIKSGICAAVLPSAIAQAWQNDGVRTCQIVPSFEMSTALVYSPKVISRSARLFLDYMKEVCG